MLTSIGRGASGVVELARIPGIIASNAPDATKAFGSAGALTGAATQFSKIPAVATAFPGAAEASPYLGAAGAALNVGGIATSDLPDDRKAFESAKSVAQAAASYFIPVPGVGLAVGSMFDALASKVFEDPYAQTRREDAAKVKPAMRALLTSIDTATTLDELNAAASINAAGVSGKVGGRGVALRGVHLDTSGQETALSDAFNARKALIEAATANPRGSEAQQLAQIQGRVGPLRSASEVVSRSLAGMFQSGDPSSAQILTAALVPPEMSLDVINNDLGVLVLKQLDDWTANLQRFRAADQGRTSESAPHVASQIQATRDLVQASQALNLDLDAARKRLDATRLEEQYLQQQNMP